MTTHPHDMIPDSLNTISKLDTDINGVWPPGFERVEREGRVVIIYDDIGYGTTHKSQKYPQIVAAALLAMQVEMAPEYYVEPSQDIYENNCWKLWDNTLVNLIGSFDTIPEAIVVGWYKHTENNNG